MSNVIDFTQFRSNQRQRTEQTAAAAKDWIAARYADLPGGPQKIGLNILDKAEEFAVTLHNLSVNGWVNIEVRHLKPTQVRHINGWDFGWSIPQQRLSFVEDRKHLEGRFPHAIEWLHKILSRIAPAQDAASRAQASEPPSSGDAA
jgi:hypothetical protein